MTIIFTQTHGLEIRIIDYYENSGEGVAHYIQVLTDRGYLYKTHNAPHDIEVRELTTGVTRKETAEKMGITFNVIDKLSIEDGIEAVRNLLPRCFFDEGNTTELLKALGEYRKEWDDKLGTFKNKPLHNWASHGSDAFRLLGVGYKDTTGMPVGEDSEMWDEMKKQAEEPVDPHNLFPW